VGVRGQSTLLSEGPGFIRLNQVRIGILRKSTLLTIGFEDLVKITLLQYCSVVLKKITLLKASFQ
jgi:hypothetical protein